MKPNRLIRFGAVSNGFGAVSSGFKMQQNNRKGISEQPSFYDTLCGEGGSNRVGDDRCLEPETNLTIHFLDRDLFPNGAYLELWQKKRKEVDAASVDDKSKRKEVDVASISLDLSMQSKDIFVRIVHAGGREELYQNVVPASQLMETAEKDLWKRFRFQCGFENPKSKPNRFVCRGSVSKPKQFQNRKTEPFGVVRCNLCFGFGFWFQVPTPTLWFPHKLTRKMKTATFPHPLRIGEIFSCVNNMSPR